jgi:hypothetical protein
MLFDAPKNPLTGGGDAKRALVGADPQANSWGSAGLHAVSMFAAATYRTRFG